MSPRRRRSLLSLAVLLVLAAVALAATVVVLRNRAPAEPDAGVRGASSDEDRSALPPAGRTGSSACTDPVGRRTWRVSWQTSATAIGVVLTPTAFESRAIDTASGDDWTDEGAREWQLRWTGSPISGPRYGSLITEKTARGPLRRLALERVPARFSPRYVTPDGGCTVFASPYGNGSADKREVAVIGDSLVSQLGPEPDPDGPTLMAAALPGDRVEVVGQGGRRWTQVPEGRPGIDGADLVMSDEIRGLRGASAQVVALGTNDTGWVSQAPDRAQFELRLSWVILHLSPLLDEVQASGQCTVVLTAEDRDVKYLQGNRAWYAEAAAEVNDLMRRRAAEDPDDGLRLWDWAAISAGHHTRDDDPWFGDDSVHLNAKGRRRYAAELARAASLCR